MFAKFGYSMTTNFFLNVCTCTCFDTIAIVDDLLNNSLFMFFLFFIFHQLRNLHTSASCRMFITWLSLLSLKRMTIKGLVHIDNLVLYMYNIHVVTFKYYVWFGFSYFLMWSFVTKFFVLQHCSISGHLIVKGLFNPACHEEQLITKENVFLTLHWYPVCQSIL